MSEKPPEIPLMEAEFLLAYRCSSCGEQIYLSQNMLPFLIEGRKLVRPLECPMCERKRGFTFIPKESFIRKTDGSEKLVRLI